jgi:hypothetical protein
MIDLSVETIMDVCMLRTSAPLQTVFLPTTPITCPEVQYHQQIRIHNHTLITNCILTSLHAFPRLLTGRQLRIRSKLALPLTLPRWLQPQQTESILLSCLPTNRPVCLLLPAGLCAGPSRGHFRPPSWP